ncbi:putative bifunctional diguanylate cyclase/phosphodiesterase [Luteimonas sp. RIT-PG2_3]
MPARHTSSRSLAPRQDRGAWARRHNQALVSLARRVWSKHCDLASAMAMICETAAETLELDRVGIWTLDPGRRRLRCVHLYAGVDGHYSHNAGDWQVEIDFGHDYGERIGDVRVVDASGAARAADEPAVREYLQRHAVGSMLDAPIRSEGTLIGVVSHEHIGAEREWTQEDLAFAGSIGDYVAMAHEIVRRREVERRLRYLEHHDPQTDLPNRDHLLEVVHSALRPMHGASAGLVAIHLQIGDAVDDHGGDQAMLLKAAARLRGELGESATIARVRDDAFAVLPHGYMHETEALNLAERCVELVRDEATSEAGQSIAAAGIAFSRDLAAPSADRLLRNAEIASQRARSSGHNRCEVFNAEQHRGLLARLRIERALREAMAEQRMQVYFQPEVDLRDNRWYAAEALVRWIEYDGTCRAAHEFIDIAEASGLIVPLGRWVLAEACRHARDWPRHEGLAPTLRVNLSARQFEQVGLVEDIARVLAETGLQPGRLCLELTETALLADLHVAAQSLTRLRELGIRIALDDFGIGYSSLAYLKRLPIDAIKLDRSFVAGLPSDAYDLAIVQAIAGLASKTGIAVVAEGVETQAQAETLRECGIVRAQGFLYARPMPAQALLQGMQAAG